MDVDRVPQGFRALACAVALAATALGMSAFAQTTPHGDVSGSTHATSARDTVVQQIGATDAASPARVDQQALADAASAPPPEQVVGDDPSGSAVSQLASPGTAPGGVDQLTDAGKTATAGRQLSNGARSATAAAPLSTPAQGKPEGVVRLEGKDRCDPNSPQAKTPACAHAIETRAAEFTRPPPTELTPEQRLLIRQNEAANAPSTRRALKRIGKNDVDADDLGAQSVASIVLTPPEAPTPPTPDPTQDVSPGVSTDVIVETIIQALQH